MSLRCLGVSCLPRTVILWCNSWDSKFHLIYTSVSSHVGMCPHRWLFWHLKQSDILQLLLSLQHIWSLTGRLCHLTQSVNTTFWEITLTQFQNKKIHYQFSKQKTKINDFDCVLVIKIHHFQRNKIKIQNSIFWKSLHALWQDLLFSAAPDMVQSTAVDASASFLGPFSTTQSPGWMLWSLHQRRLQKDAFTLWKISLKKNMVKCTIIA